MSWSSSIIQGCIGSLFATTITAIVVYITRKWWFNKFQSELAQTYKGQGKLLKALKEDIKDAQNIRILSMRGETVGEEIDDLFKKGICKVTVLMSSIMNDAAIEKRCKALDETIETYNTKLVSTSNIYKSLGLTENDNEVQGKIRLKFHMVDLPFRLIFIDDYLYVSSYPQVGKVNDAKHFKYKRNENGGSAYVAYEHYFASILSSSKNYNEEQPLLPDFTSSKNVKEGQKAGRK